MSDKEKKEKYIITYKNLIKLILLTAFMFSIVIYIDHIVDAFFWILAVVYPFILGGAIAFIINIPMSIIETKLLKKEFKLKRTVSLLISLIIVTLIIVIIITTIIPQIVDTFNQIKNKIPSFYNNLLNTLKNNDYFMEFAKNIESKFSGREISIGFDQIVDFMKQGNIQKLLISTFSGILSILLNFVIAIVFSIYILTSKEKLNRDAKKLIYSTLTEKGANRIYYFMHILYENFRGFIQGQLIDTFLLASICFIGMMILKLPQVVMISIIIMVLSLIPIFGSMIGTILGFVIILVDNPSKAVIFVIFMIVILQIDGNFIYPKIVGKKIGLPPIFTLVSIVVGSAIGGIVGMWVTIPVFSSIYTIIKFTTNRKLVNNGIDIDKKPDYSFISQGDKKD